MFCQKCNSRMKHILRFYSNKTLELDYCPKCHYESKEVPMKFTIEKPTQIKRVKRRK